MRSLGQACVDAEPPTLGCRYSPPMKAAVHTSYGPPDVVRVAEVEKPAARDNQVLVKVHAATVNRADSALRAAKPFVNSSSRGSQDHE